MSFTILFDIAYATALDDLIELLHGHVSYVPVRGYTASELRETRIGIGWN